MGFLLPDLPDVHNEGPRLDDLQVSDSAYGKDIPIVYGTMRLGGNIIWATELEEEKVVTRENVGGKGGGGGQEVTTTTYYYYAYFAIGFAEALANSLLRVWADGKLIYSNSEFEEGIQEAIDYDINFRFYTGNETQEPDALLSSRTGGLSPAYRGLCYMVFERMPLIDFGNRIPSITAEINFTELETTTIIPIISSAVENRVPETELGIYRTAFVDEIRDIILWQESAIEVNSTHIVQFSTLKYLGTIPFNWDRVFRPISSSYRSNPENIRYALEGYDKIKGIVYGVVQFGSSSYNIAVNPFTGIVLVGYAGFLREFRIYHTAYIIPSRSSNRYYIWSFSRVPILSSPSFRLHIADFNNGLYGTGISSAQIGSGLADGTDANGISFIRTEPVIESILPRSNSFVFLTFVKINENIAITGYIFFQYIQLIQIQGDNFISLFQIQLDELSIHLNLNDQERATSFRLDDTKYIIYNRNNNTIILFIKINIELENESIVFRSYAINYTLEGEVIYVTRLNFVPEFSNIESNILTPYGVPSFTQLDLISNIFIFTNGSNSNILIFDIFTGDIHPVFDGSDTNSDLPAILPANIRIHVRGAIFFDSRTNSLILYNSDDNEEIGHRFFRIKIQSNNLSLQLSTIVADINKRISLNSEEYDVSQLTDIIHGYVIDKFTTAKALLQPLAELYFFDVVERNGQLVYVKRGGISTIRIKEENLIRSFQPVVIEEMQQDLEIPAILTIDYINIHNDYQEGTAQAKRTIIPNPTIYNGNNISLRFPLATDAQTAKRAAEIQLYNRWLKRQTLQISLPSKYIALDPTDIIEIELEDGTIFTGLIEEFNIGVNYSISIKLLQEKATVYTSNIEADGGHINRQLTYIRGPSELFLLDIPIIRDIDIQIADNLPFIYSGAAPYRLPENTTWRGASLYQSMNEQDWTILFQQNTKLTWGITSTVLGDPISPWRIDRENSLDIVILVGINNFVNISELQLVNGQNLLAIFKNNGEIELIQFQNVEIIDESTIRISNLLRGRRGTETMAYNHSIGERIVLLEERAIEFIIFSLDNINMDLFYRLVTQGQLLENTISNLFTLKGRVLKPYAPVHYEAERQVNDDIRFTWERRTRYNGGLRGGTGLVPLNEESEKYEIEIYDGNTILRTITDIDTTQYDYTIADQQQDGLQNATELSIMIYQISALVGRGFSQQQVIEIS